ncbi:uncharacterized protein E0L32_003023 [Thyridium curvatum]|uniref:Cyanovirin-N domain-containing protein n=1 Tax=Thyridium curvatum TaxID=1093900 RepID=A0A507BKY1_9PEZI|nr:uncharacterized protein E0L32_003023 [Thyridium curvatum]TPX17380.1 hypothetical protein E0L32_003023 [Thyridium curvatum]
MVATVALLVTSLGLIPQPIMASYGFANNCEVRGARLSESFLGMYCNNHNTAEYLYNWTWIDLNLCVSNYGGRLIPKKDGAFFRSCKPCSVKLNGSASDDHVTLNLGCNCKDVKGHTPATILDLNTLIGNDDGAMTCYDHRGNKTWIGPA